MVDEFPDQGGSRPGSRIGSPSKSQILRKGHKNWSLVAHRFGRVQGVVEAMISSQHKPVKKINGMDIPEKIEDVPLRNQDRRLLNARHKRLIAKRIICFGISTSLIFLGLGIALIEIHCLFQKGKQLKNLPNKNKDVLLRCHESLKLICFSKYFQTNINMYI